MEQQLSVQRSDMTTTAPATQTETIPGYIAGRWAIDPIHSDISFSVRHMMVSKVRGHFREFEGELVTGTDPRDSEVTATIQVASVDTNNEGRDNHVRSGDFFDAAAHPTATYRATGLLVEDGESVLNGELTLRGVTKQVPLQIEANGFALDPRGDTRAGFTGRGKFNRSDFGVSFGATTDGVVLLSDNIDLTLEIEAILQPAA
jgi:polyisoprenoid-binding protein YceI